jgi:raffinose synthase
MVQKLKKDYQIADVGIWHTLDGYWRGINPNSPLGKEYKNDLIPWEKLNYFISPNSNAIMKFYNDFYSYLKSEGISFVKVDNQVVTEDIAVNNFPIFKGAEKYHEALNASASKYFNNALINCMDMTPDAYLNFGNTAVARAEEDYFPIETKDINDQTYQTSLKKAANHIEQAIYNSLYFSQMVYPDFDMFESTKPDSTYQAIARAINEGPIYVTDKTNEHNFNVLFPLIYNDGTILHPTQSLVPTEDCLFQLQDPKPFKAFSMDGKIGLLGVWNISHADSVTGTISPSDIHGIQGEKFAIYEYFSKKLCFATREQKIPLKLSRPPYRLFYILPLTAGNAIIGLINKYNAPAAIISSNITAKSICVTLYEGGTFAAVVRSKPKQVLENGKTISFHYADNLLIVHIPINKHQKNIYVKMQL